MGITHRLQDSQGPALYLSRLSQPVISTAFYFSLLTLQTSLSIDLHGLHPNSHNKDDLSLLF